MDEIVSGIQVIKMYAWEGPFRKIVEFARKAEIKIITKASYLQGILQGFVLFTARCALFCTLLTFILSGQKITAAKVFVITFYFNILSLSIGTMFTRGVSEVTELFISIKRIRDFLLNEEYNVAQNDEFVKKDNDTKNLITLKNLTVKWNTRYINTALENINLDIPDGHLFGIIGPVGSGKSSLLQTILNELAIVDGTMKVSGNISYASQDPWVFAATIRQNIVFGQKYDKKRYDEVIQVCALDKDFYQFEKGDLTLVGDRGASLSGGQKARINLARAVYKEADIYIMDDPLSAVDIHVSKVLYEKCINGYLAKKTRILVTHQVHYLKNADSIVILNNGRIEEEGTFNSLGKSNNLYAKLLMAEPESEKTEKSFDTSKYSRQSSKRSRTESINNQVKDNLDEEEERMLDNTEAEYDLKNLQEESSKGKVHGSLLFQYIQAGVSNIFGSFMVVFLFISAQLIACGFDYWVSYWVNLEIKRDADTGNSTVSTFAFYSVELTTKHCLIIFFFLLIMLFVLAMGRSIFFFTMAMSSSKKLHSIIFDNVVGATMRFFDTNPGGRILNRFSKDIGSVDELLPKAILDFGHNGLTAFGTFLLIAVVSPYFLIMIAFLGGVFGTMRHIYLKSSRNIKRLEGIMRSPVFTHLKATLEGLTTIRAFGTQNILVDEFNNHQDYHTRAWYMFIVASNAFGFYVETFCASFYAFITFTLLIFGESLNLMGGQVGLAITQALTLILYLQWAIKQSTYVSNHLMSVERVLEYQSLPKEIQPVSPKSPPANWPAQGGIVFKDMCLRYFEDGPLVLKYLNLSIKPSEKVGVVGRTGAGKSSIIQALFRLTPIEGSIKIDEIDTKDISLPSLRQKISIIPQDPVLFSGTLRHNLDPFAEYTDEVLYKAIADVELKDPANIINRLENKVMDRGSNYSVGQRQLICLARAILKNNKILMLDEATANVDPQTDALIQKTIRLKFKDCTVITVAHRLNTIMDSDRVLVMDSGHVAEFDHPYLLIQKKDGVFSRMVTETGPTTSVQLIKEALESYKKLSTVSK